MKTSVPIGAILACALVTVTASVPLGSSGDELTRNNVVIVLDASGSMIQHITGTSSSRMSVAKSALLQTLTHVRSDTNIGILVFGATEYLWDEWVYPLGPRDDELLREVIGLIRDPETISSGTTPLGTYIKKGADRLLEQREAQKGYGTYRLLIVTDGEATGFAERRRVAKYVPEVIGRGITIDVIGVAMKSSHTLTTKVHSYRSASDSASLKKALAEILAETPATGDARRGSATEGEDEQMPEPIAAAILKALSDTGGRNWPIGEEKPATAETEEP